MTDGDGIFGLSPLRDLLIDMPNNAIAVLERIVDEFETQYNIEPLSPTTVHTNDDMFRLSALKFISKHLYHSSLNKDDSLTLDFSSQKFGIEPLHRLKRSVIKMKEGKIFYRRSHKNRPSVDLLSLVPDPTNKKYKNLSKMIELFSKNYIISNHLLAACITPYLRRENTKLTKYTKKDYQNNKLRDDKRIKVRIRKLNEYLKGEYFISFDYDRCILKPQNYL